MLQTLIAPEAQTRLGPTLFRIILMILAVPVSSTVMADALDDFEGGLNNGGWSFGVTTPDVIETMGGNPDGWLHNPEIVSFAPIVTAETGGLFSGDFRALLVREMEIDAQTLTTDFGPPQGFHFSILLRNNGDSPSIEDDDFAYFVGPEVPQPGEGWIRYDFEVPSDETTLPTGWTGGWPGDPENFRPGVDWNDIITDVDQVEFWWINPAFFAIVRTWNVGVDNIRMACGDPAGVGEFAELVSSLAVLPNPSRGAVRLHLDAPLTEDARLSVFDARGRRLRTLNWSVDRAVAGEIQWDGKDDRNQWVPSGVYLLELETPSRSWRGRTTLIRR